LELLRFHAETMGLSKSTQLRQKKNRDLIEIFIEVWFFN
jgi:hypothetical protein